MFYVWRMKLKCILILVTLTTLYACHSRKGGSSAGKTPTYDSTYIKVADRGSISFSGGNGSSMEHAVVINNAKGSMDGVSAEYYYIEQVEGRRGDKWAMVSQALLSENGKSYDLINITIIETGKKKSYYFDITGFFGKW
jgi:hypothetical protein